MMHACSVLIAWLLLIVHVCFKTCIESLFEFLVAGLMHPVLCFGVGFAK